MRIQRRKVRFGLFEEGCKLRAPRDAGRPIAGNLEAEVAARPRLQKD